MPPLTLLVIVIWFEDMFYFKKFKVWHFYVMQDVIPGYCWHVFFFFSTGCRCKQENCLINLFFGESQVLSVVIFVSHEQILQTHWYNAISDLRQINWNEFYRWTDKPISLNIMSRASYKKARLCSNSPLAGVWLCGLNVILSKGQWMTVGHGLCSHPHILLLPKAWRLGAVSSGSLKRLPGSWSITKPIQLLITSQTLSTVIVPRSPSILILCSFHFVHISDVLCADWSLVLWQPMEIVPLTKADDYISISNLVNIFGCKEWCHGLAVSFRATVPSRD